jgi:hypothetical protein
MIRGENGGDTGIARRLDLQLDRFTVEMVVKAVQKVWQAISRNS